MRWLGGEGWRDPLGVGLVLASLVILALLWRGAAPAPGLTVRLWHAASAAR